MRKIIAVLAVNAILLLVQFGLISYISDDGEKVWYANRERMQLETDNQILKQKIYSQSSLSQIKRQAEDMGLIPMKIEFWRKATVAQIVP
jgi:hypothetical protein